jgi:hypothetical protein
MSRHLEWLFPQLRAFPDAERPEVLRKARRTAFDVVELVGLALSLVLVTALTRYGVRELTAVERVSAFVVNFAVALLLLGMLTGPFLVRRIRRGIDRQLEARLLP